MTNSTIINIDTILDRIWQNESQVAKEACKTAQEKAKKGKFRYLSNDFYFYF